jgi:HK97 gp10 family phage protein
MAGSSGNPGGDTFYFRFLEFGTSKMAARPFIRPALSQNAQRATDVVVESLNKEIDKAIK